MLYPVPLNFQEIFLPVEQKIYTKLAIPKILVRALKALKELVWNSEQSSRWSLLIAMFRWHIGDGQRRHQTGTSRHRAKVRRSNFRCNQFYRLSKLTCFQAWKQFLCRTGSSNHLPSHRANDAGCGIEVVNRRHRTCSTVAEKWVDVCGNRVVPWTVIHGQVAGEGHPSTWLANSFVRMPHA